jgi:hypothetical protein
MNQDKLASIAPAFAGLEFSTFKLKPGVGETELRAAAARARDGLMAHQPGFLGHAVLRGEDGVYVDMLWASSKKRATEICGLWVGHPDCADYLGLIEPGSESMAFFERVV